jgi:hypothetical protein
MFLNPKKHIDLQEYEKVIHDIFNPCPPENDIEKPPP